MQKSNCKNNFILFHLLKFKYSFLNICVIFLIISIDQIYGLLAIIKIITRMPKQKDVGLIFDVTLENINTEKKELLDFHIRADGYCCVNISSHGMMGKMGRVVGGDFGFIEAGATVKVSLIWPTVSLYNRVGVCHIIITSTNLQNEQVNLKQTIKFDTRFEMLDPDGHTIRKDKDFVDCKNWDKDYFKNCTPVDCEERYFGLRNYYNETSENCEEVARCVHKYQRYNFYTNECIDTRSICTKADLKLIKEGKFDDDDILDLKPQKEEYLKNIPSLVTNEPLDNDASQDYANFFGHDYFKRFASGPYKNEEEKWLYPVSREKEQHSHPAWLEGLGDGLLIVFATILIYILICFCIFLIVTWLSRRSTSRSQPTVRGVVATPKSNSSEANVTIYSTSSLMSQR